MYHPENIKIGGNVPNGLSSLSTNNIDHTLTENNKHLAKAFEAQCKDEFDEAFEYNFGIIVSNPLHRNLQAVWNNLSFLIEHADQQPNTHSIIRDYRVILENLDQLLKRFL